MAGCVMILLRVKGWWLGVTFRFSMLLSYNVSAIPTVEMFNVITD